MKIPGYNSWSLKSLKIKMGYFGLEEMDFPFDGKNSLITSRN
jgi:hypothetical protein